jgi:hypothetical protein
MVDNMDITELEPYVRNMVAPREVRGVPPGLAVAVVERISDTRLAEFQGCSAMVVSMLVWETFLLFDKEKVTREQALPAMRVLAKVAAAMPMERFLPIDVAQITINLAKFRLADAMWFSRLAAGEAAGLDWEGVRRAKGVEQSIANTIYGLALVNCSSATGFIDQLLAAAVPGLPNFKPQGCGNMLWGLAKLQHPLGSRQLLAATGHKDAESLINTILRLAVLPQLHMFKGQEMTNTVYSLALLQLSCDQQVIAALVARTLHLIQQGGLNTQGVGNILWSCVKLNHRLSTQEALQFVNCMIQNASASKPQHMANTMWALATGGHAAACLELQQPLQVFLEGRRVEFEPQDISNIAISLAKLGHHSPKLMGSLLEAATPKLHTFLDQQVANLLWSLAVLEPTTHHSFFKKVEPLMMSRMHYFDRQTVSTIAWAHAVVLGEQTSAEVALGLFCAAAKHEQPIAIEGLTQLFQLMAVSSSEVQAAVEADASLRGLRERCGRAYAGVVETYHVSPFDKQVQDLLPALRVKYAPSYGVKFYGGIQLPTHLLQREDGQQVVFDWVPASKYSSHSTTGQQHHELGYVVVRRRMLAKAGWTTVVMIPGVVWEGLKDEESRLQYLRSKCRLQ